MNIADECPARNDPICRDHIWKDMRSPDDPYRLDECVFCRKVHERKAYEPAVRQPSDNRPDILVGPTPIPADWLTAVERRIWNSINPHDVDSVNDGRWLRATIATGAMSLFQRTSDVLPGEPFIYSSRKGDLVAEFSVAHGTMTNIVSQTTVTVFAVVDGVSVEKWLDLGSTNTLREELRELTKMLHTGWHGAKEKE